MEGYCGSCQKRVRGIKKPFSVAFLIVTFIIGGWLWYPAYRIIFVHKNKCPICGCKISRKELVRG